MITQEQIWMAARAIYYEVGSEEDFDKFYNRDFYHIVAEAALDAALGDTHVIVPKESTREMTNHGAMEFAMSYQRPQHSAEKCVEDIYNAMIAAYTSNEGGK